MIAYRMMDETCLLPACLHGGPIPLASLRDAATTATGIEKQEGIDAGTLARFLQALCQQYGSCAVLAVHDDVVVGKLRFAPAQVERMLSGICLQQGEHARGIADLDLATLPARNVLEKQLLRLDCYQVADGYRGQGIAKHMLEVVIEWARATGWEALSSSAIRHIPPLLNWTGQASLKALQKRGFAVVGGEVNSDLREGVISQRLGHHGDEVKQQWSAFADISEDEAAMLYELVLDLQGKSAGGCVPCAETAAERSGEIPFASLRTGSSSAWGGLKDDIRAGQDARPGGLAGDQSPQTPSLAFCAY